MIDLKTEKIEEWDPYGRQRSLVITDSPSAPVHSAIPVFVPPIAQQVCTKVFLIIC